AMVAATPTQASTLRAAKIGVVALFAAIAVLLLGYLLVTVPAGWFPRASTQYWPPRDVQLTRGSGALEGNALIIDAQPAGATSLIWVNTDLRSTDYRVIAWSLSRVPEQSDVRLYWRSDYAPAKMNSIPLVVAADHVLPVDVSHEPTWIGRITGLAISIRTPA